jgi:hypothetical protein
MGAKKTGRIQRFRNKREKKYLKSLGLLVLLSKSAKSTARSLREFGDAVSNLKLVCSSPKETYSKETIKKFETAAMFGRDAGLKLKMTLGSERN